MATCLGTASPSSPLPSLSPPCPGGHALREAVGGCQHPVPGEHGPPAEMGSIIAKTDLPRPPAQAGVLAAHNAIDGQLPVAAVCGERGSQGPAGGLDSLPWGSERSRPSLGRVSGHDPNPRGLRNTALIEGEGGLSEETQPHLWGSRGAWPYFGGLRGCGPPHTLKEPERT